MDPLGHLAPWLFRDVIKTENVDIRPTIAITKAHMKLPELEESVRAGRLVPDGRICLNTSGELAVTKFAVEPVWYLPGIAERFGIGKHETSRPSSVLIVIQMKEVCEDLFSRIPVDHSRN